MVRKISGMLKDIKSDRRWLTVSNVLTFSRILIAPVVVFGIQYNYWRTVFFLLIVAGLTDVLDGYLARLLGERTMLGTCLDPIADKLLLISSFSALCFVDSPSFSIPIWFVFLIFMRETIIIGGSILLLFLGVHFEVSPSAPGKLTTFFQLIFILWIFICYFAGWNPVKTYSIALFMLAAFSIVSLAHYAVVGIRYLHDSTD